MKSLTVKYGRLQPIEVIGKDKYGAKIIKCLCDCGTIKNILAKEVSSGRTKSCGCLQKEMSSKGSLGNTYSQTHGMSFTRAYRSHNGIMQRCYNPNVPNYKNYGGTGIKVHPRWHKFENFYADMGECPEGYSLDRIDNNRNYEPGNCRWVTRKEQQNNRRSNKIITIDNNSLNVTQWSELMGIKVATIFTRLERGWSEYDSIMTPVKNIKGL